MRKYVVEVGRFRIGGEVGVGILAWHVHGDAILLCVLGRFHGLSIRKDHSFVLDRMVYYKKDFPPESYHPLESYTLGKRKEEEGTFACIVVEGGEEEPKEEGEEEQMVVEEEEGCVHACIVVDEEEEMVVEEEERCVQTDRVSHMEEPKEVETQPGHGKGKRKRKNGEKGKRKPGRSRGMKMKDCWENSKWEEATRWGQWWEDSKNQVWRLSIEEYFEHERICLSWYGKKTQVVPT
eukprot:TRINITY_DN2863_c0_g1_i1.p1 TRINITY_DN2863_c0_g1~~TRINITY_DN2863_c0_g1_i1.p1  ORF type:complete len:236 (+),score=49.92 TRINITY_DN2863_c0_g1_i1:457-1164(+)